MSGQRAGPENDMTVARPKHSQRADNCGSARIRGVTADASRPPAPSDVAWSAAITTTKAAVIALAVDAFVNSDKPRFRGKAMKVRAIGYSGALLIVPIAWRLRGRQQPYPRELDLLVTLPILVDA